MALGRLEATLDAGATRAFLAAAITAGAALPEDRKRALARWTFERLTAWGTARQPRSMVGCWERLGGVGGWVLW